MASDSQNDETGHRPSTYEMVRELRQTSIEQVAQLATMAAQIANVLEGQTEARRQHDGLMARLQAQEVDSANMRVRMGVLEAKPAAMSIEERAGMLARVAKLEEKAITAANSDHELRGKVQIIKDRPPALTPGEAMATQRLLEIATHRDIHDLLTDDEIDDTRALLKRDAQTSWSHHSIGLTHRSNWPLYLVGLLAGVSGLVQIAELIAHAAGR